MSGRVCSIPDCGRPFAGRDLCNLHYQRWLRYGDPLAGGPVTTPRGEPMRFVRSVLDGTAPREPNGCILWPYGRQGGGYGQVLRNGRQTLVGWIVLEHFDRPRPSPRHWMGHALHEVCGHRHCVAPEHLTWQTIEEQLEHRRKDGTFFVPEPPTGLAQHMARHSDEEVRAAVERVRNGETVTAVAESLGVSRPTVARWCAGTSRRAASVKPAVRA